MLRRLLRTVFASASLATTACGPVEPETLPSGFRPCTPRDLSPWLFRRTSVVGLMSAARTAPWTSSNDRACKSALISADTAAFPGAAPIPRMLTWERLGSAATPPSSSPTISFRSRPMLSTWATSFGPGWRQCRGWITRPPRPPGIFRRREQADHLRLVRAGDGVRRGRSCRRSVQVERRSRRPR